MSCVYMPAILVCRLHASAVKDIIALVQDRNTKLKFKTKNKLYFSIQYTRLILGQYKNMS